MIDVLLLHRSVDGADVIDGITAALSVGAVSADVVAVEARRHASALATTSQRGGSGSGRHRGAHGDDGVQRVVSLTQRRLTDPAAVIAGLPPDTRPVPRVDSYDELLPRRNAAVATSTQESAS